MSKIFIVWEREYIGEHAVILLTEDENIAKETTGESKPCSFGGKQNHETNRCYEAREIGILYSPIDPG